MRVSYLTDLSGKQTAIVIDIKVWNQYLMFNPEAMYFIVGNTFEQPSSSPDNIFKPEPMNPMDLPDEKKN